MKNQINKKILYLLFVFFLLNMTVAQAKVMPFDQATKHYEIALELKDSKLVLDHVYVIGGKPPVRIEPEKGYRMQITSFNNQILDSFKFAFEKNKTTVRTPYFENGKRIEIFDQNGIRVLDIDVSRYAKMCGNNICEQTENSASCPKDCPVKNGKIGISTYSIIIAATIIIIALIFFLVEMYRKRFFKRLEEKKQLGKNEKLRSYIDAALKKGYKTEDIEKGLVKLGWPKHLVDGIIDEIGKKENAK